MFESTARDFIDKAIRSDRDFLQRFNPEIDRAAFEREWAERSSGARTEVSTISSRTTKALRSWGTAGGTCSAIGPHRSIARAGHHLTPRRLLSRT